MNNTNNPWDSIYQREGRFFTEPFEGFEDMADKFAQHSCRRILDLGCGNGRHVIALAKKGFRTTGLDISPNGLRLTGEWLHEEALQAGLVSADTRRYFPFEAESFDGLISTQVIHHALLADVRISIAEIRRVLTPGGMAFITMPSGNHKGEAAVEIEPNTYVPLDGKEKGLPHHIFTEQELRSEFGMFQIDEISLRNEGKLLALWLTKAV
jgi:tellurite methyltransferase